MQITHDPAALIIRHARFFADLFAEEQEHLAHHESWANRQHQLRYILDLQRTTFALTGERQVTGYWNGHSPVHAHAVADMLDAAVSRAEFDLGLDPGALNGLITTASPTRFTFTW